MEGVSREEREEEGIDGRSEKAPHREGARKVATRLLPS
jgi:hypothetical protein